MTELPLHIQSIKSESCCLHRKEDKCQPCLLHKVHYNNILRELCYKEVTFGAFPLFHGNIYHLHLNDPENWKPKWTNLPEASVSCAELQKCRCRTRCHDCECARANLKCIAYCSCRAECYSI